MEEIWKDIKEYEGLYQVSNLGRVRSLDKKVWNYTKKGRILKQHNNGHGYYNISLHNNDKTEKHAYVHILVAQAFIPNPNNYFQVNHKDFNKNNNCVDNLEWVSPEQNRLHYRKSNYSKRVEKDRQKNFSNKTYEFIYNNKKKILELYDKGYTILDISKEIGIGKDAISSILKIFDKL